MVVRAEDLIKNKKNINSKKLNIEIGIDKYLIEKFDIKNPQKKIRYFLWGGEKKYYKNNSIVINELYKNAGWNIKYKKGPKIQNYSLEELIFNYKKIKE